jgi:hypothetical protein
MTRRKIWIYSLAVLASAALFALSWLDRSRGGSSAPAQVLQAGMLVDPSAPGAERPVVPGDDSPPAAPALGDPALGDPALGDAASGDAASADPAPAGAVPVRSRDDLESWLARAEALALASRSPTLEELAARWEGSWSAGPSAAEPPAPLPLETSAPESAPTATVAVRPAPANSGLDRILPRWERTADARTRLEELAKREPLQGLTQSRGEARAILGGRLRSAGDLLGPSGARLVEIRPRSVVLTLEDARLELELPALSASRARAPTGAANSPAGYASSEPGATEEAPMPVMTPPQAPPSMPQAPLPQS